MDQQTISLIIIGILVVFLIFTYLRRKSTGAPKVDLVEGILKEIAENDRIREEKLANPQSTKKFQLSIWKRSKDKVPFLDDPDVDSLHEVYNVLNEYNEKIDLAHKNQAILQNMELERLRELLSKCRKGLSEWLRTNRRKELEGRNRSGFGDFFKS